jgi:sporulation protein YlmC with PRC-barrel domain
MLRKPLQSLLALTACLTFSGWAVAQAQRPGQVNPGQNQVNPGQNQVQGQIQGQNNQPNAPAGTGKGMRLQSLLGATVNLQGGTNAGTVQDIIINEEGVIDYVVVSENNKLVTVPWDAVRFNYQNRTAFVNINADQFRQIPTYTTTTYPDYFTPEYRTQTFHNFGIAPGRERRLDRREDRRP